MIDIAPADLESVQQLIAAHFPRVEARVFGSRYRWHAKDYSDLDIALVGKEKLARPSLHRLREAFAESTLPFRVDVLDWHAISPEFQQVIAQGYEVIQKRGLAMSFDRWERYKLGELGKLARGKSKHRPRGAAFLYGGPYPFIQTGDIKSANHKIFEYSQTYNEKGLTQSKLWPEGTIAITIAANIADTAILTFPACFPDSVLGFVANREMCDIDFVEYLLQHYKKQIQSHAVGSVQDNINLGTFKNVEFEVPSLPTQRRIADILSALDDKIELNRQTNATLEAIAQAIFKEWFVDFNFPGATGRMVESNLGLIPEGWKVGSILEIADLLSGGTPRTKIPEYWNGEIKWVSAKDVGNALGTFVLDTERKVTQVGVKNSSTKILPELTTIVTARGTVGSYCILAEPMSMNQTNYGLKAINNETDYFVFYSLSNLVQQLQKASYGTIFDTVTTRTFKLSEIIIPPKVIMREFNLQVAPIMEGMLNNLRQSNNLAKLRDTLLPKLMNGEINVGAYCNTPLPPQPALPRTTKTP